MASILIAVIYLAFVSMGIPDAILGAAWPAMQQDLNVPVSYAGIISFLITAGTVISSLMSDRLIRRLGTGKVTLLCTALVTLALLGFSCSNAFWQLCLIALPYGLGAGSIDAALNNYVALNYKSRHMSFIHFFWGLGAAGGPMLMSWCLTGGQGWNAGYRLVFFIQLAMTLALLLTLPLWKAASAGEAQEGAEADHSKAAALRAPGAKAALLAFFGYCAMESTAGMWASSFLTTARGLDVSTAAGWASLFYAGITIGRLLNGFVTDRLGDRTMVRTGQALAALGAVLLLLPSRATAFAGLLIMGFGCAPVFPCLLHETPTNFGEERSQTMIGLQMACAYVGSALTPPVVGWLAGKLGMGLYPVLLLAAAALMTAASERMNAGVRRR